MNTGRHQCSLGHMMELAPGSPSNTFNHIELMESYKTLGADLPDYIVSLAFGDTYSRTNLTQQEQTMVAASTLVALDIKLQLKLHIDAGLNVGLTKEKIVGTPVHCIPYAGFPRVFNTLTPLKEVMVERGPAPWTSAD